MTIIETAKFLHIKPRTIRSWVRSGVIAATKEAKGQKKWIIDKDLLLENEEVLRRAGRCKKFT